MSEVITPQKYGAIADGQHDDTEAFQAAVNSGYDVYVPTSKRETYLITKPIRITKPQCKRIFSEPIGRTADTGAIIFDLSNTTDDPKTNGLFDIHNQLFCLYGIRFISRTVDGHRAGVLINAMNDTVCDYDIRLEQCNIKNFYKIARFTGRGLEIINSRIGSCQYLADLYWDDEKDSNKNHPAKYDQRAIAIKNCRLHNIGSAFLIVRSGHAYGLHFEGNTIDNGRGYLIRAYDQAYGWNISGNIIQGIQNSNPFMEFRKGMLDCIITGNTFISDKGYWEDTTETVNSWIKASGNTTSSIISNNVFKNTENGFLYFKNMNGVSIVGNTMHNSTASTQPAINIVGTCQKSAIIGNVINSTNPMALLSKKLSSNNSIIGNYPNN